MADSLVFVACHTGGKAPGLNVYRFDAASGALAHLAVASEGVHSPLQARPDRAGRFLYVADNVPECDGTEGGAVAAYAVDRGTGGLTFLNRRPAGGAVPCYVSFAADGRWALVANYGSGSVSVLPIASDGSLGPVTQTARHRVPPDRQKANAHCFLIDPTGRFALACDLGLDQVLVYRFDAADGHVTPHEPAALPTARGAGPRHLAFHPEGRLAFCQTEYDNTMIALRYDGQRGALDLVEAQPTLPSGFQETSYGADVHVHPNGRFVYGSNRGHESIVIFEVDTSTGRLTLVGHEPTQGQFPRGFAIDPTGRFMLVANEKSDSIVTFRIDEQAGALTPAGPVCTVAAPSFVAFA